MTMAAVSSSQYCFNSVSRFLWFGILVALVVNNELLFFKQRFDHAAEGRKQPCWHGLCRAGHVVANLVEVDSMLFQQMAKLVEQITST